MQVAFPSSPPEKYIGSDGSTEISTKLSKLGFSEEREEIRYLEKSWSKLEDSVEFDEDEEEFSFAFVNAEGSPIDAEEAFEGGQIRPVYPLFNRDLLFEYENADQNDSVSQALRPRLRKLFVDESGGDGEAEPLGPYCSWTGERVWEASPETCRKSNSTGFSRIWRFKDLVWRSNSDGRDAFVFVNNNGGDKTKTQSSRSTAEENKSTAKKKGRDKTTSSEKRIKSAHEKLYMRNRAMREEGKHRSYLPYKQVGFFTNVSGLTRNIHPF